MSTATKTVFNFNTATLGLIKQFAANSTQFKSSFSIVREDAFVFGYQGGNFNENFNMHEKWHICRSFSSVESLFDFCDSFKSKQTYTLTDVRTLSAIFQNLRSSKEDDERFSDIQLIEECFGITEFWKYLSCDSRNEFDEIIACLNLHEWLQGFIDQLRMIIK